MLPWPLLSLLTPVFILTLSSQPYLCTWQKAALSTTPSYMFSWTDRWCIHHAHLKLNKQAFSCINYVCCICVFSFEYTLFPLSCVDGTHGTQMHKHLKLKPLLLLSARIRKFHLKSLKKCLKCFLTLNRSPSALGCKGSFSQEHLAETDRDAGNDVGSTNASNVDF